MNNITINVEQQNNNVDSLILSLIKNLLIEHPLTLDELGNKLNSNNYKNTFNVFHYGHKRKLNTYIKLKYGGMKKYIENNNIFKIINDRITVVEEEDFILI